LVYIWLQVNMSNYGIKHIIITNRLKCQFGIHHCDGLVETIEMDISFAYFGARVQKILNGENNAKC
jgi:hypothetical protein